VDILAEAGTALQQLLGPLASEAARVSGVIVRQRTLTPLSLARTFVLGFLKQPAASDEHLARMAAQSGTPVTPQAIGRRHTPKLVRFLEDLFRRATRVTVGSDRALAPLLGRFPEVVLLDSTTIRLPDGQRAAFPGCGGSHGGGAAAVKLQVELDLTSGRLSHIAVEAGRTADGGSARQTAPRAAGSLRIADPGYFSVGAFAALVAAKAHFLSRLHYKTGVRAAGALVPDLLRWLAERPGRLVDEPILLGPERLACRLIAWRLPPDQAARRRRTLRREVARRSGGQPSAGRLAWCDWTILVTSVSPTGLSAPEAVVLYRARWQIELLFKRWKGQDLVAELTGSTEVRQMVRVWARLLAAVVQHWLVVAAAWGDPTRSWSKVAEAVRDLVGGLATALRVGAGLGDRLAELVAVVARTCRRDPRKKPGTVELLNDVSLLDFGLS
jgi:hypothetical protein